MIQLDNIQLDYKVGSIQHKMIALLSKQDSHTLLLRNDSGATIRADRVREILDDMKRNGIVTSRGTDEWAITNQGLHVSVLLGPVPATSVVKRRTSGEKLSEMYERGNYEPKELGMTCLRQGAYDAYILPSRIGNSLHYPKGRKESAA